ncbi:hypothetical protein [Coleofasciculus sp. FACHB-1120]|nr:hypothetical protein [Coleofasciculus sp. FACHB-1120]MBD2744043.1 hypothetical protein [Coleofasciculus sp. FACHB-1120]
MSPVLARSTDHYTRAIATKEDSSRQQPLLAAYTSQQSPSAAIAESL